MKTMIAKYPGTCAACGESIQEESAESQLKKVATKLVESGDPKPWKIEAWKAAVEALRVIVTTNSRGL